MKRLFRFSFAIALPALLAGCLLPGAGPSAATQPGDGVVDAPVVEDPVSAPVLLPQVVYVEVFRLTVPFGTVSANEDFWKQLDEHAIDFGTSDRLWKNGIRAGVAANRDWNVFKDLIDRNPASVHKQTYIGKAAEVVEIMVNDDIPVQDLFMFQANGRLTGRTFENAQNLWSMNFRDVPGKPGVVRAALNPVVRSQRRRVDYVGTRDARQAQYTQPEHLYEVNLRVDVPADSFLIVAPSVDAQRETSIGNRFLTGDTAGEKSEVVFLLVPRSAPIVPTGDPTADPRNTIP